MVYSFTGPVDAVLDVLPGRPGEEERPWCGATIEGSGSECTEVGAVVQDHRGTAKQRNRGICPGVPGEQEKRVEGYIMQAQTAEFREGSRKNGEARSGV